MAEIDAAVAHCPRNGDGLLKLGGLWLESRVAHSNLSSLLTGFLAQHEALAPQVVHVKTGRRQDRGMFATEAVAKQLAQLIPPERLWRESSAGQAEASHHVVLDVASETSSDSEAAEAPPRPDIGAQLSAPSSLITALRGSSPLSRQATEPRISSRSWVMAEHQGR